MKTKLVILLMLVVLTMGCQQKTNPVTNTTVVNQNVNQSINQNITKEDIAKKVVEKYNEIKSYRADVFVFFYSEKSPNMKKFNLSYVYAFEKPNKFYIYNTKTGIKEVCNGTTEVVYSEKSVRVIKFLNSSKIHKEFYMKIIDLVKNGKVVYGEKLADGYYLEINRSGNTYKLWISKEYLPVKLEYTIHPNTMFGPINVVEVYRNASTNNVDSNLFNIKIPKRNIEYTYVCDNFEQAEKYLSFKPVVPSYTDDLKLYGVLVIKNNNDTLFARYVENPNVPKNYLYITEKTGTAQIIGSKVANVNGTEVYSIGNYYSFKKGKVFVNILSDLSKNEILKIIKSMI